MSQTTHQAASNSPAFIAYHVPNRRNAGWVRIGAAWGHKDGEGFSLKVEMLPLEVLTTGTLNVQLRRPETRDDEGVDDNTGNIYP